MNIRGMKEGFRQVIKDRKGVTLSKMHEYKINIYTNTSVSYNLFFYLL